MSFVPEVVSIERLGRPEGPVDLVVEVPHGADAADFARGQERLRGPLPADLVEFFHLNTDTGAWDYGRRVAAGVVAAAPDRAALVLRCRVPRTFIDCNRVEGAGAEDGLTAAIPAYVRDDGDRAWLVAQHRAYLAAVDDALATLAPGGFVLLPHSYGPRTLDVGEIDDDIVPRLRAAHARIEEAPLRPEVDLITRTADGTLHAPAALVAEVAQGYRDDGWEVAENATYHLHPVTVALRTARRFPERTLCLELRRDRLVSTWIWNQPSPVDPAAVERAAAPLTRAIDRWMR